MRALLKAFMVMCSLQTATYASRPHETQALESAEQEKAVPQEVTQMKAAFDGLVTGKEAEVAAQENKLKELEGKATSVEDNMKAAKAAQEAAKAEKVKAIADAEAAAAAAKAAYTALVAKQMADKANNDAIKDIKNQEVQAAKKAVDDKLRMFNTAFEQNNKIIAQAEASIAENKKRIRSAEQTITDKKAAFNEATLFLSLKLEDLAKTDAENAAAYEAAEAKIANADMDADDKAEEAMSLAMEMAKAVTEAEFIDDTAMKSQVQQARDHLAIEKSKLNVALTKKEQVKKSWDDFKAIFDSLDAAKLVLTPLLDKFNADESSRATSVDGVKKTIGSELDKIEKKADKVKLLTSAVSELASQFSGQVDLLDDLPDDLMVPENNPDYQTMKAIKDKVEAAQSKVESQFIEDYLPICKWGKLHATTDDKITVTREMCKAEARQG